MEEALRESEASFRDLADTAPAMMWTTDEDGLVTFVNEGWMRFTGTRLEDELGASWQLGVHPDDAEVMLRTWDEARGERRSWEREYRLLHHSGEYRWIVDRGVPRYEGGRYAGYVGTAIDIHERKTMEGRLLEVYQREHKIAETLQRSLLPERLPQIDGPAAGRPLPARRSRRRDRRRLVRRARAPRRPRGAGGGRRGRPRPARRRDHGPAPQRLPRLRPGRVLAGRGGGAHQPARDERRGGRHGHRGLPGARPGDRRGVLQRRPGTRRRSCSRRTGRTSSRAGARCRSEPPTPRCSARRAPCFRRAPRCCSTRTASWSAATWGSRSACGSSRRWPVRRATTSTRCASA